MHSRKIIDLVAFKQSNEHTCQPRNLPVSATARATLLRQIRSDLPYSVLLLRLAARPVCLAATMLSPGKSIFSGPERIAHLNQSMHLESHSSAKIRGGYFGAFFQ